MLTNEEREKLDRWYDGSSMFRTQLHAIVDAIVAKRVAEAEARLLVAAEAASDARDRKAEERGARRVREAVEAVIDPAEGEGDYSPYEAIRAALDAAQTAGNPCP